MSANKKYKGIIYMLLAALGFSMMGGAAKLLNQSFNAGQLVFYRNMVGLIFLLPGIIYNPPVNKGERKHWLIYRGVMGTLSLYTLLFCILHMPLGTAMTYNLSSIIFIALFSLFLFQGYYNIYLFLALLLGFLGMLLIYKPNINLPLQYHVIGILSGISSAIAYLTVGSLTAYYDSRIIVLWFIAIGIIIPVISMFLHHGIGMPTDGLFVISWQWPKGNSWFFIFIMGLTALLGQYFVTKAYGSDKANIVSIISYANIPFSIVIGLLLGDPFPDMVAILGIFCIICSGIVISFSKNFLK